MLKILYAASDNQNAKLQLHRFIQAIKDKPVQLKIAAYKDYSPNVSIDWTLDSLLNLFNKDQISFDNLNFKFYFEQIKYYNPDLIISDLEYFTSYIANELNITLWQCSSSIINFALTKGQKYNLGIFKEYSYVFNKNPQHVQRIVNILDNSNYKFVYSHFGDYATPPEIQEGYEWIRPYHKVGKQSINCKHDAVISSLKFSSNLLKSFKKYEDVVLFSEEDNIYSNFKTKNIYNEQEYFCNIKNSNVFACEGQTTFLADAFYNGKKPFIITNYGDTDCIINSVISKKFNLIASDNDLNLTPALNNNICFLHEKISEYL